MSGGIVQLVAVGAQDTWLSGKPEISFFRSNYKRYTHYAAAPERQTIQGIPYPGSISTIRIEKKGDLLSYMYLTARDNNGAQVNNLDWSNVIDRVELLIGGQVIDLQDYNYMTDVEPCTGAQNYNQRYLNNDPVPTASTNLTGPTNKIASFFPFKFFFCKDWSVSLPLVALQYHDVEIRITWSPNLNTPVSSIVSSTPVAPSGLTLYATTSPNAFANLFSAAVVSSSNTTNLVYTSNTLNGPIFTGMVVGNLYSSNAQTLGTIQSLSTNVFANTAGTTYSNAVISFSNSANTVFTGDYPAGSPLNFWRPPSTATVASLTGVTSGGTTATLVVYTPINAAVLVGQAVIGLPLNGIVYVSNITSVTRTTTTMTLTTTLAQPASMAGLTVGPPTIVSFVPSNYASTSATTTTYSQLSYQAWCNFVYLDQSEREYFAQSSHDILITQVQRVPVGTNAVQELALAHPVKFLAFQSLAYGSVYNSGQTTTAVNYQMKIQINGVDVGESRPLPAWTDANQYYHTQYGYLANNLETSILVIPYCLDTSKLQPTGTLNFSRLDTYRLVVPAALGGLNALTNQSVAGPYIYAVNYNVLRIQKGMGSVLYAS